MTIVSVQIHTEHIADDDLQKMVWSIAYLTDGGMFLEFSRPSASVALITESSRDRPEQSYVNVTFQTADIARFRRELSKKLKGRRGPWGHLAKNSIIVCQGKYGWDDYLLLHHFKPNESLDT